MKRTFSTHATPEIRADLERLLGAPSASQYRDAMRELGKGLARVLHPMLHATKPFAVVTTPEDADFLTRGLLEVLPRSRSHLVCYWTERHQLPGREDVATVVQSFIDPAMPKRIDTVIVVKSVIATGCIVRTHLEQFLTKMQPRQIAIAAPVMRRGADRHLRTEFPKPVSARFEFVSFAVDDTYEGGVLKPGVGGRVDTRLGLKAKPERFSPALIEEWRAGPSRVVA